MELENSGVMEQEAAAPAPALETGLESNSEQAEAATGQEESPQEEDAQKVSEGVAQGNAKAQPEQTPIPDAVWAAARRRAEAEAQRKVDAMFAQRFGSYTNPATGRPVQTVAEYLAALDAQQEAMREKAIREAAKELDPGTAQQLIEAVRNDPERQRLKAQVEEMERQQRARQGEQLFADQLREITKIDPGVKSLSDISTMPEFPEFDRLMRSGGHDLLSAYKLACFDRLAEKRAQASHQAAINAAKGKQHLAPVGTGAAATRHSAEIPANILPVWRELFPDDSLEQLNKRYNDAL